MSGFAAIALGSLWIGALLVAVALAFTLIVEVPIAALFRVGRRGLRAVGYINCVTNPALNFIMMALYGFGVGFQEGDPAWLAYISPFWPVMFPLEALVVLVEWRLALWALQRDGFSSRRLLALSATMNAASFGLGLLLFGLWTAWAS